MNRPPDTKPGLSKSLWARPLRMPWHRAPALAPRTAGTAHRAPRTAGTAHRRTRADESIEHPLASGERESVRNSNATGTGAHGMSTNESSERAAGSCPLRSERISFQISAKPSRQGWIAGISESLELWVMRTEGALGAPIARCS